MNEPGERLLNLARALSDGERVDWERAAAESEGEDERELLTLLQEIEQVAEIHRTLRREGQAAGPPSSTVARWGPLEIQEKIGEGASAEVFRARDPRLDRDVALKLFRHGQWMSPEERRGLPCIGSERADLVVAGCAILESILDIWPADRLGVADRGIREGILRSLMAADAEGFEAQAALRRLKQAK